MCRSSLCALCLLVGASTIAARASMGQDEKAPDSGRAPEMSLDAAFRAWHKGFSSSKKEERQNALRSMLPKKDDIAHLFPQHAEKLWPKFEQGNQFLLDNVDRLAKEIVGGGAIKKVEPIDIRKDKNR